VLTGTVCVVNKIDSFDPPKMNPARVSEPRPPTVKGLFTSAVRDAWRRLRLMRTALYLLGVVGLESILATIAPQRANVPSTVNAWLDGTEGPGRVVSEVLQAVGAFEVYTSPLFIATLLLLFTSLTACLIPRFKSWWRITRHSVPPLTRHLGAQEHVARFETALSVDEAAASVRGVLSDRRFRTRDGSLGDDAGTQVAAEKGLVLREGGSLIFHVSFYILLVSIILGQLTTFEGFASVTEGEAFTDTQIGYGIYEPGRWWQPTDHAGFTLQMDEFKVEWIRDPLAPGAGTPTVFESDVTLTLADGTVTQERIRNNHPLVVDGFKIHLLGWGYAPLMRIREGATVVYEGFVTTVFNDEEFAFTGIVKAPAATPDLGLEVFLVPYAPEGDDGVPVFTGAPWADAPVLAYQSWTGDLNLSATPNVGELNTTQMTEGSFGFLRPGQIFPIGGTATLEFVELRQWTNLQVSRRPQVPWLLLGAGLLLIGLLPALYAYRRRVWVGIAPSGEGRTIVTVAGRAFQRPHAFEDEFVRLHADLRSAVTATPVTTVNIPTQTQTQTEPTDRTD
jgi:cytochrome c biogenesis protein